VVARSLGVTNEVELSEHPNSTNTMLAISKRATDRTFMILPFLMICGLREADMIEPPLGKQVWLGEMGPDYGVVG
jgi:hypothetical protein